MPPFGEEAVSYCRLPEDCASPRDQVTVVGTGSAVVSTRPFVVVPRAIFEQPT